MRPADSFRNVKAIFPYSIWVEGDNIISSSKNTDDRLHRKDSISGTRLTQIKQSISRMQHKDPQTDRKDKVGNRIE